MSDEVRLCKTCDEPVTRPRAKYCEVCRLKRLRKQEQYEPRDYPLKAAPLEWYDDWDSYASEYD